MTDHLALEDLSAYLDDELDEARRAEVAQHLAECPRCSAELESLEWSVGFLRAAPRQPLPRGASLRIEVAESKKIDRPWTSLLGWVVAATAAAVLLIAVGANSLLPALLPVSRDAAVVQEAVEEPVAPAEDATARLAHGVSAGASDIAIRGVQDEAPAAETSPGIAAPAAAPTAAPTAGPWSEIGGDGLIPAESEATESEVGEEEVGAGPVFGYGSPAAPTAAADTERESAGRKSRATQSPAATEITATSTAQMDAVARRSSDDFEPRPPGPLRALPMPLYNLLFWAVPLAIVLAALTWALARARRTGSE